MRVARASLSHSGAISRCANMVSSSGPKAMWAGRVRRAGIRRWARCVGGALVRHSRRKDQRICRRARRLVHHPWTISSGNSRFQVSDRGKGGPDESGVQEYASGPLRGAERPCITPSVRPDGYAGGSAAVPGHSCVTPGQHCSE